MTHDFDIPFFEFKLQPKNVVVDGNMILTKPEDRIKIKKLTSKAGAFWE